MKSIIIDQREPDQIKRLTWQGTDTAISLLTAGDLWIAADDGNLLIIERKTPEDFLASIKDGRLFEQVIRMVAISRYVYVIITGALYTLPSGYVSTNNRDTGWKAESVEGAKITIQELGAVIIECKELEYLQWIERLANRDRSNVRAGAIRNGNILSPGETCLTALPGIGLDKAQQLLECNTPARALEFLTRLDLQGIQGIGPKTKENVKRALGLKPDESLIVTDEQIIKAIEFLEKPEVAF